MVRLTGYLTFIWSTPILRYGKLSLFSDGKYLADYWTLSVRTFVVQYNTQALHSFQPWVLEEKFREKNLDMLLLCVFKDNHYFSPCAFYSAFNLKNPFVEVIESISIWISVVRPQSLYQMYLCKVVVLISQIVLLSFTVSRTFPIS